MIIPVFFSCDDKFARHASVSIVSLLSNRKNGVKVKVHILYSSLSKRNQAKLKEVVSSFELSEICFENIGSEFSTAQELLKISKAMYYRLLIPDLFPKFNKAIYLDSDVVVNSCISDLFSIDLRDNYIGAVQSPGTFKGRTVEDKSSGKVLLFNDYLVALGMKKEFLEDFYINSGVVVFNCKKYREDKLLLHIKEILSQKRYFFAPDQDVLSVVTQNQKLILPLTWNFQTTLAQPHIQKMAREWLDEHKAFKVDLGSLENSLANIVHFVFHKPWDPKGVRSKFDFLYWKYLVRTPWSYYRFIYFLQNIFVYVEKAIKEYCILKVRNMRSFLKSKILYSINTLLSLSEYQLARSTSIVGVAQLPKYNKSKLFEPIIINGVHIKADQALRKLLKDFTFHTVLDIGSGRGYHADFLTSYGKIVTKLDYGLSLNFAGEDKQVIVGDYLKSDLGKEFDAIWCSHVLEHQLNVNAFLKKVHLDLKEGGVLALTVPPMKHEIVGGHVSVWNPGLLIYNLVLAGFDCSQAAILKYEYNISVIIVKKSIDLPLLTFDAGDINILSDYFPSVLQEKSYGDIDEFNWFN